VTRADTHFPAADQVVRDALVSADRRRRARHASGRIWRTAPLVAAAGLGIAVLARWAGWSPLVPTAMLSVGALVLVAYFLVSRRRRPVSDASAAAIDAGAGFGGELRSAAWFAARDRRDDWADFHVQQAAERVRQVDWRELYPAVRAGRAKLTTAVVAVGALALAVTMPERVGLHSTATAVGVSPSSRDPLARDVLKLPPELQQQLAELLAALESSNQAAAAALAGNTDLREMLNKFNQLGDPELLEALARAMAAELGEGDRSAAEDMQSLAERARRAAESAALSRELREALDKLAGDLEITAPEQTTKGEGGDQASGIQEAETGQGTDASGGQNLSIQFSRESDAGGGVAVMMASDDGQPAGGPPGAGAGGASAPETAGTATSLEAALKKETVEASQDNPGSNVETEIRRKTEHGNATVAFTGRAAATFDRTRAAAPPPVPESRRTGVQTYFVRKP
jgi:hypothetical protein